MFEQSGRGYQNWNQMFCQSVDTQTGLRCLVGVRKEINAKLSPESVLSRFVSVQLLQPEFKSSPDSLICTDSRDVISV
ncbi:hypothetical protein L596_003166 [Steinernema carpocapsae]|uniref:Uncharacterized protein n=1 Tax=Steinernema carpocapsae TaxID=34508 RepID=A0A4U8UTB6_STECR|nr:hypothetical protein L596_003166 [Steinernema carpocapsae]